MNPQFKIGNSPIAKNEQSNLYYKKQEKEKLDLEYVKSKMVLNQNIRIPS